MKDLEDAIWMSWGLLAANGRQLMSLDLPLRSPPRCFPPASRNSTHTPQSSVNLRAGRADRREDVVRERDNEEVGAVRSFEGPGGGAKRRTDDTGSWAREKGEAAEVLFFQRKP